MATEVMVIFTAKSVESCLEVGGSQSWVLDRVHARRCKYAILCRNAHTDWGDGKEPHGTAFMVGHVSDVVPSTDPNRPDRWLIKFDEYARIDIPNFWQGWRNPIRYTTFEELSFSLEDKVFEPVPEATDEPRRREKTRTVLTIAEAKKALAATFGVKPEAVEIIIHG